MHKQTLLFPFLFLSINLFAQVYKPNDNLILNGDFTLRDPQQRPLLWFTGTGLQSATISGQQRMTQRTDDYSLKLADSSVASGLFVRSEKRIVNPGTVYTAKVWVKSNADSSANFNLEFWDQNNIKLGTLAASSNDTSAWKELVLTMKAPDKSTHATVTFTTTAAYKGISFCDKVSLKPIRAYDPVIYKNSRELFIDDYRIDSMVDLERVVVPGKKSPILIKPTEPWEGTAVYIYGTVLYDQPKGSGYRMWYGSYKDEKYYLCYATSRDGTHWVKPKLGLIEFDGSKQNNISRVGGGTVIYDAHDKDPERRYKLMSFDPTKERFGYNVYFSKDGLKWNDSHQKPVLPYGDVSNIAYDTAKRLYIATTKQRMLTSNTSVTPGKNDRIAFVSVSKDFITWSAPEEPGSIWTAALEGDPFDDMAVMAKGGIESNVYGMPVYPYHGSYIGFPWMFDIMRYDNGVFAGTGDGKIQPHATVSRDLRIWDRPLSIREPIIPLGKAGAWDDGTLYTASNMLENKNELTVYYGAMNLPHGGSAGSLTQYAHIAKATWRKDGFVALQNEGKDTGTVVTKPITFEGKQLKINAQIKTGGKLFAELLNTDGSVIAGYDLKNFKPIIGDCLNATAAWTKGSDLSKLNGQKIILRLKLFNGSVYSYWFE